MLILRWKVSSFNGTRQSLGITVTSVTPVTQPLVGPMANQPSCPNVNRPNSGLLVTAINYRAMAEVFAELLFG
jgi:hypothetical protein